MPSPATCRLASLDEQIAAQHAAIARFETALWENGFNAALLPSYQSAWRRLETLLAKRNDPRHRFILVIPVADSPVQLQRCLDSLLELCRAFAYGGMQDGYFSKIAVLLADDSHTPEGIAAHRTLACDFDAKGLTIEYFGLSEQLALLDRLDSPELGHIIGNAPREAFGRKGQAIMRNIAWLHLAQRIKDDDRTLIYTLDADQQFKVKVDTAEGDSDVCAINFFAQLDAIFSTTDAEVLTGKVVGDPPVSPAVMAGTFLDDVAAFLQEMAASNPAQPYRREAANPKADAAYHDMAGLFGFEHSADAYRYRCRLPGEPSNADCFADFARRLKRFFHGEHLTRITGYRHQPARDSVLPARTVYTGNYVFRPRALQWFIPFAPLRLRMSGPTLGRLMKAGLGPRFVCANLPMLHTRTLDASGAAEFRPGVVTVADQIDLADEFERQFFGDVMLFTVEQLTALGFPQQALPHETLAATLDAMQVGMAQTYRARQDKIVATFAALIRLLDELTHGWQLPQQAASLTHFRMFLDNIQRNFGADSTGHARIASPANWQAWRQRQLAALTRLPADRCVWNQALAALNHPPA
ncbi:MAG TPA: hypothetical protein PLE48_06370 [Thiobacillus sp.]|nr:MAG: hypothetical protein B7Y50_04140 [Hydrogenophilales bacterium 28-61-11]OYZ56956.1 MAG: hypothetical protein B7Y21_09525 [Hydrogenophilales bacterium 16-61-112]OZA44841.1 MAG: hypothetical protein B7X81_09350 [Hydrogenophilales bacterium 17-61-76]HQT30655.1 hypothetical protein [Thiobacillus sp.]HQT70029.1 hypothetical protein [Thiobacillus sp.]